MEIDDVSGKLVFKEEARSSKRKRDVEEVEEDSEGDNDEMRIPGAKLALKGSKGMEQAAGIAKSLQQPEVARGRIHGKKKKKQKTGSYEHEYLRFDRRLLNSKKKGEQKKAKKAIASIVNTKKKLSKYA